MIPRLAALSIAEIIEWTSFASGFAPATEIPFCIPRSRVSTVRLRRERLVVWRARLEADRVLAMVGKFGEREGRGDQPMCQDAEAKPGRARLCRAVSRQRTTRCDRSAAALSLPSAPGAVFPAVSRPAFQPAFPPATQT